ncbi:MAG: hypothetical protein V4649_00870 [Bacteroidota bacterium]
MKTLLSILLLLQAFSVFSQGSGNKNHYPAHSADYFSAQKYDYANSLHQGFRSVVKMASMAL